MDHWWGILIRFKIVVHASVAKLLYKIEQTPTVVSEPLMQVLETFIMLVFIFGEMDNFSFIRKVVDFILSNFYILCS
jgi:hypothetical protein